MGDAVSGFRIRLMAYSKSPAFTSTPSSHLASLKWKVQVIWSSLDSQDSAIPGSTVSAPFSSTRMAVRPSIIWDTTVVEYISETFARSRESGSASRDTLKACFFSPSSAFSVSFSVSFSAAVVSFASAASVAAAVVSFPPLPPQPDRTPAAMAMASRTATFFFMSSSPKLYVLYIFSGY